MNELRSFVDDWLFLTEAGGPFGQVLRKVKLMRDFRSHTLYYVFVDRFCRFCDGDLENKGGKNPACYDATRTDPYRFWGGDLEGLTSRLDYLANLGVTCLRLTSVFEQMGSLTLDRGRLAAPYHGQWVTDYRRIEPHLLPQNEWDRPFSDWTTAFDRMVKACQERGIRVILDVVCDRANPGGDDAVPGEVRDDGRWLLSVEHDTLGWFRKGYHRDDDGTGDSQIRFNENSASFRNHIQSVLEDWATRGVDGYCFDAVHRLPIWFWQELTSTLRSKHPILSLCGSARTRSNWEEAVVDFANQAGLRLLDAAFQRRIVEGLCWKDVGGFRRIAQYLEHDEVFEDATSLITCLDNETTPRLLSQGLPPSQLVLALTLLMTSRGIPCIFYGTEQGLHDDTNGGVDPFNRPMMSSFDPDHPAARALAILTALRRDNLAVQRGHYKTLWLSDDVLVYRRIHAHDGIMVALNRGAETKVDLANAPLPDGPVIDLLEGMGAVVNNGLIQGLVLPQESALVFDYTEPREIAGASVLCRLSGYASRFGESVVVTGNVPELGCWGIRKAVPLHYVNRNLWMGDVVFDVSCGAKALYKYAVVDERGNVVRESVMPRLVEVPVRGGTEWADRWTQG